ncbi:hypothetical protein B0H17DRAFT_1137873 [Mycena rosella]|uniref:BTB domain-containing protein n=1 Tax=Mycena rosella TaxID=1033263 RepID=A0AAD7D7D7_MYCRO|nr:hypothetical protein B0H17DRAFT_1137873 [Mycena rosella]
MAPPFSSMSNVSLLPRSEPICPDGTLYKLHPSLLGARSPIFASMFSLPRGLDCPEHILSEGKIDKNPIHLPSCMSQYDFDSLLTYLFLGSSMHPKSEDFLISVMKLSALFNIEDGIAHTTQELHHCGNLLHPALQFELTVTTLTPGSSGIPLAHGDGHPCPQLLPGLPDRTPRLLLAHSFMSPQLLTVQTVTLPPAAQWHGPRNGKNMSGSSSIIPMSPLPVWCSWTSCETRTAKASAPSAKI